MIKLKGGDPKDWHEGDMADEIVERDLGEMSMSEVMHWARTAYEAEIKSWPPHIIRERWESMQ